MPVICLGTTHVLYIRGWIQVCVKEEPYSSCNLFKLCKHTLKPPRRGCIYVFKCSTGSNGSRKIKQGEYLSISNPCLCLECVDVYYNQHDPVKKPLVLVFKFKNGDDRSNGVTNRYYRMSCFETDKTQCPSKKIEDLCEYNEQSILCALLQENDSLPGLLTYDIMKRPTGAGNGEGGTNCKYNCGKIQVTKNGDDTSTSANGEPKLGAGFTRYKHAPTNSNGGNSNGNNAGKPACIIYRCQTLMGGNGTQAQTQELPEIQGQTYKCVSVYFGCKAKRNGAGASTGGGACPAASTSGSEGTACKPGATACSPATGEGTCPAEPPSATTSPCNQDVPLLLELHRNGANSTNGASTNPEYYAHLRSTNGARKNGNGPDKYYWVKLPCGNGADGRTNGDCVLKNLLDDIGLHTSSSGAGDNGHETLKQLLKQALNNGATDGANGDLTEKLQKMTGQNLTKLLKATVNGSQPSVQNGQQNGSKTLATLLLKRLQFDIIDSLVILLEKNCKNAHNGVADGYGDSQIQSAISGLQPNGRGTRVNRLKLGNGNDNGNGTKITVTEAPTDNGDPGSVCACLAKCFAKYGYCVIQHDFSQAVNTKLGQGCSAGLRLLLPTKENNERGGGGGGGGGQTKYAELRLYNSAEKTDPQYLQYLYYTKGAGSGGSAACTTACTTSTTGHTCSKTQNAQICSKLYVVFYKGVPSTGGRTSGSAGTGDPRPLLLCYRGCWYRPKDKNGYFSAWVKVDLGDKGACECSNGGPEGAGANCEKCKALFKALTTTVGFLNTVDLFQHPGTAGGEAGQTTCQPGEPGAAGATATCQSPTSSQTTGKCTYEVHQFRGSKIQVQVKCCPVNGTTASSGCYRKLTHRPAGTGNGSNSANTNNGFRLGDVVYCPSSGSSGDPQGSITYYGNGSDKGNGDHTSTHKWAPLTSVAVYYYNEDKGYCDPLLVELQFAKVAANGLQNGATTTEYYRLKTRNGSGGKLEWAKVDNGSKTNLAKPECLTRYLDAIRYCLKKVVRIQLEKNKASDSYDLVGKDAKPGSGGSNGFQKINGDTGNGKQIQVQECKCPKLTGYKCYQHKLGEALNGKHHLVAGLAFTLPGKNNGVGANGGTNGVVEIPVCVVGQGEAECPPGATEGLCTAAGTQASCSSTTAEPTASTCPAAPASPSVPCKNGQPNGTQIPPVHYNQCMGDVCVYFYGSGGGTSGSETGTTTDTVPLMLRYNGQFYRPCDRDQYFTKWVPVTALCKTAGECKGGCACCCPGAGAADPGTSCGTHGPGGDGAECGPECPCCKELANELDRVNECLNRIDLDPEKASKAGSGGSSGAGTGYGLPESNGGKDLDTSVGNNRVCLTEKKPTGDDAQKAYVKVVHRTKNGFRIGCLTYCGKEITQDGVTPTALSNGQCDGPALSNGQTCSASPAAAGTTGNGTIKIEVAKGTGGPNGNGNHKNLVTTCGWNTVVVYYSTSDKCYSLPQLIVLLNTDGPVKNGEAVTGSADKKYGYYVLSSASTGGGGLGGGPGYEYTWRLVNGSKSGETPVTLDDKTDFQLLNAAVILLEQKAGKCIGGTYGDDKIKKAVGKAGLQSPGNDNDVNRLKNKTIEVKDETKDTVTCSGTSPGTCCCKCLKDTGFKAMTHNLDKLVKLNGSFKPPVCEVALITGLKFLIPTGERGKYKQVQLNGDAAQNGSVKYHHPDNGNKVCVYFYGCDPRPLLVCYNGWAYRAKDKNGYNEQKWAKCTEVQAADAAKCGCAQTPPTGTCDKCPLIKALVGVSDFLNPVDVKQVPNSTSKYWKFCRCYCVHKFNGCKIWIRVTSQPAIGSFCYNKYTHTHAGITGKGDGFRLGNIHYDGRNKGENGNNNNSNTCIKLNGTNSNGYKCISASDVNKSDNKHKASPEVVVFYYKGDTKHEHPLLVALRSPDWCFYYNTYFELTKKSEPRETKLYKKNDGKDPLDLSDTKPGGELAQKLDSILFKISKKLQIVLSTRPVATEYKPGQNGLITDVFDTGTGDKSSNQKAAKQLFDVKTRILKEVAKEADELEKTSKTTGTNALTAGKPLSTRDSLMHHVTGSTTYKAQLSNGASEPPSGPTTTQIQVEEVHCPGLQPGGYRCFKHDLVNTNNIEQVGGLVLCLWVDKAGGKGDNGKCQPCDTQGSKQGAGKEGLELCTGKNGCKNGSTCKNDKNGQSVQLSYTTCKGNLYVKLWLKSYIKKGSTG
ncbi:conserved hypothetical protein [Theileria orientalis strain Shintoku]|uniref:Uncharacterized protein n=1 Tax=Theileria orientalis strain Shintoku TaxID=869250 RepID=J4C8X3_THEOR|nr:conserved hypothetical protein [Theileria orientalis strain Shintoku]BAM41538.1 conserved hypothetical protein [Theileria orientalis strain Shintoku]|eukprot:XP_009691839.1 conserved hypothetical protein [Theileria orientalis strain Shintoku]